MTIGQLQWRFNMSRSIFSSLLCARYLGTRKLSATALGIMLCAAPMAWPMSPTDDVQAPEQQKAQELCIAAERGDIEAIQRLCQDGADPNIRWSIVGQEVTPLYCAVCQRKHKSIEALCAHGADPNETMLTTRGTYATPLYVACQIGDVKSVRELCRWGANPDKGVVTKDDTQDIPPLCVASRMGHHLVVKKLREYGASLDKAEVVSRKARKTPLIHAINEGHVGVVKALLLGDGHADATLSQSNNLSPLIAAAYARHTSRSAMIKLILNAMQPSAATLDCCGVDEEHAAQFTAAFVNQKTQVHHTTALHGAFVHRDTEAAALLLHAGADPTIKNANGDSAWLYGATAS